MCTPTETPAEHEKHLATEFFHAEVAKVTAALTVIEHADLLDWATYAEQFETAAQVTEGLLPKFIWAADEAARHAEAVA